MLELAEKIIFILTDISEKIHNNLIKFEERKRVRAKIKDNQGGEQDCII